MDNMKICTFIFVLACAVHTSHGQIVSHSSMDGVDFAEEKYHAVYVNSEQTTTIDPEELGSDCIDRKGKRIPVGQDYHPHKHSPCTICECLEDKMMMSCSSVGCEVLECLSFNIDEDSCCGYTCDEGGSRGELDLRQVGSNSVLVQWTIDDSIGNFVANLTWEGMTIYYSEGFGKEKPWLNLPTKDQEQSAMVTGLRHGVQYTFKAIAKLNGVYGSVELSFKGAQIVLEQRTGNSLKLEKQKHAKNLLIERPPGIGKFRWPQTMYINFNAFDYVSIGQAVNKKGQVRYTLRLHDLSLTNKRGFADLKVSTSDAKLFRWMMVHL